MNNDCFQLYQNKKLLLREDAKASTIHNIIVISHSAYKYARRSKFKVLSAVTYCTSNRSLSPVRNCSFLCLSLNQRSQILKWCCYINMDFATAVSQNGFSNYKLFPHEKTNINQKNTKNITFFITFIF